MIDKFKPYDTTRVSAFFAAISAATERVNDFSGRLATLSNMSDTAAFNIAKLSTSAAQMVAVGQRLATCCQYTGSATSEKSSSASSYVETALPCFVTSITLFGGVKLYAEASEWLWMTGIPLAIRGAAAIGRLVLPLQRAVSAWEAVAAIVETVGELIAAVGTLAASLPVAATVAAAALLAGSAHLVWRYWSAIVRAIPRLVAAVAQEAISIMHKLMTAVEGGEPEGSSTKDGGSAGDAGISQRKRGPLYSIVPSVFDSVAARLSSVPPRAFAALNQPPLWHGFQQEPLTVRKAVAIALLGIPLLAPTAMAAFPSRQGGAEVACAPSIIINSSPTIVINSSQPFDIEDHIADALRRHRDALYEQLCSELQRRQRTDF